MVVNLSMLHFGEEPPITGTRGSGAVFFEGCTLGCPFCQNYKISRGNTGKGKIYTPDQLADEFLRLESLGAHNINLVTPMHFAPEVSLSIGRAKDLGLKVPVLINTGGYDKVETLKLFEGLVDIYLPDMKFYSDRLSYEILKVKDYRKVCEKALEEMYRQTGPAVTDENGIMKKGMIVRHLMIPGQLFDTKKVLDFLTERYFNKIYISLMNQYTPMPQLEKLKVPEYLKRKLPEGHYRAATDHLILSGHELFFTQEEDASGDLMIPGFN
ncbi:MAG: radical SAM protein [Clostridiales bacterium]|nr:radical SAM protein [Clostridiales bacterium]